MTDTKTDAFDSALYFGGQHDEEFSAKSPAEYLETFLRDVAEYSPALLSDAIVDRGPIEVFGYAPKKPTQEHTNHWAAHLTETFFQLFEDEFGNFDGGPDPSDEKAVEDALVAALTPVVPKLRVWQCEPVGSRTYSTAMVEAMLRDSKPQWFQAKAVGP